MSINTAEMLIVSPAFLYPPIKTILASAEQSGLEVKYIAAPEYLVKYKSMNAKKGEKEFVEKLEKLNTKDAEVSFEVVK